MVIVINDTSTIPGIMSQMALVARSAWSNPPNHGARIVHLVLTDPELRKQWLECMQVRFRSANHNNTVRIKKIAYPPILCVAEVATAEGLNVLQIIAGFIRTTNTNFPLVTANNPKKDSLK